MSWLSNAKKEVDDKKAAREEAFTRLTPMVKRCLLEFGDELFGKGLLSSYYKYEEKYEEQQQVFSWNLDGPLGRGSQDFSLALRVETWRSYFIIKWSEPIIKEVQTKEVSEQALKNVLLEIFKSVYPLRKRA